MPMIYPNCSKDMPKICPRYAHDMPKICPWYAQDIHKISDTRVSLVGLLGLVGLIGPVGRVGLVGLVGLVSLVLKLLRKPANNFEWARRKEHHLPVNPIQSNPLIGQQSAVTKHFKFVARLCCQAVGFQQPIAVAFLYRYQHKQQHISVLIGMFNS